MEWERYDSFGQGSLAGFDVLEVPLEDGQMLRMEDAGAMVEVADGTATIDLPEFSRFFDGAHLLDDPKVLYASSGGFPIPERGALAVSVEMAASSYRGNDVDYRDGTAGFVLQDMATGMVFDHLTSGRGAWAVRERLALPHVPPEETFTYLSHSPFVDTGLEPGRFQTYEIVFERAAQRVRWLVEGALVLEERGLVDLPEQIGFAFGLFTLHPQPDGKSTSIRGQGMRGSWRNFRVGRADDA